MASSKKEREKILKNVTAYSDTELADAVRRGVITLYELSKTGQIGPLKKKKIEELVADPSAGHEEPAFTSPEIYETGNDEAPYEQPSVMEAYQEEPHTPAPAESPRQEDYQPSPSPNLLQGVPGVAVVQPAAPVAPQPIPQPATRRTTPPPIPPAPQPASPRTTPPPIPPQFAGAQAPRRTTPPPIPGQK